MGSNPLNNSIYSELGVRSVIHAGGTKTTHGGTRMRPEVLEAMKQASESFVDVAALNRAIGRYIAEVTGAEAGMVTSGAASGVVLSAAACMTGTDPVKVMRLPDTAGMKSEIAIQRIHLSSYTRMYSHTGAKLVEIGNINECLPQELDAAISDRTAAVAFLFGPRVSQSGLTLPQVVSVAHRRGVPVIVDAAAMLPPKDNLRRFIEQGADLVVFSGGKEIHGPQNTGLLFGRKGLVEAAMANASPNFGIARSHKVSREDMVGLYTALKLYMETDEAQLMTAYRECLVPVIETLKAIPGLKVTIEHDELNYHVPTAAIEFLPTWEGRSGPEIARAMLEGEPPVFMQYFKALGHLTVSPISLQEGEVKIVARRLYEELIRR